MFSPSRPLIKVLLFFLLYLGVGGIAGALFPEAGQHTAYFSHGVALAFTILYGPVVALGVFISQVGLSLGSGAEFPHALVLAEIWTLTSLAEGLIFRRLKCSAALASHRDTLILLVLILLVFQPPAVLAAQLLAESPAGTLDAAWIFKTWLGNSNGQVLITPFILLLCHWFRKGTDWNTSRSVLLWSAAAALLTVLVFFAAGSIVPKGYRVLTLGMLFPFFILLSIQCSFLVVSAALLTTSTVVFFIPLHDSVLSVGPFFPYKDQVHLFLLGLNVTALLVVSYSQSERRMRSRLEASEHKFRMLFQNMSQAFVFGKIKTDSLGRPDDFTIILMNDRFAEFIGHRHLDAVGRSLSELLPAAGAEVLTKFWDVAKTGVPFEREYFSPVFDKHIKVVAYSPEQDHIAVLLEDISKRVQAQNLLKRREQEFSSAFHGSNIGVALVDLNGNFRLVNAQLCKITGYSKTELESMNTGEISHPEDRGISAFYISRAIQFGEDRAFFEKRYVHKTGRLVYCLVAISLIQGDEEQPGFFIGHVQDITLLKVQAERINKDNEKLARLNEMKHTFISIIGHDLRNPVGSMRMLSKIARNGLRDGKIAETEEMLNLLIDQSEQTYNLLSDLVEWGKVQSRETFFPYEEIPLSALVEKEISAFKFQAADKDLILECKTEGDPRVVANYNMVRAVIRNLISNAVKFSFPGSRIEISAVGRQDDVLICVKDSGCGIPKDSLETIFCPYSRISTPGTRNERGIGFGLPMCKEFVEQHGGKIWADSEEGAGSRFYVTFPRGEEKSCTTAEMAEFR